MLYSVLALILPILAVVLGGFIGRQVNRKIEAKSTPTPPPTVKKKKRVFFTYNKRMADGAYPPKSLPSSVGTIAGYIGDPDYTPHVWTKQEWGSYKLRKLPIWVYNPKRDISSQAKLAVQQLRAVGFKPYWVRFWKRNLVVLDLETLVIPNEVRAFNTHMRLRGYRVITYGSMSTVFKNPADFGYWVALYDGIATLPKGALAKQYMNDVNKSYDLSVISRKLWRHLWTR